MTEMRGVVQGMDCANCVAKVRKNLENTPGVEDVKLNLVSTKLILEYNNSQTSEKDIIKVAYLSIFYTLRIYTNDDHFLLCYYFI